MEWDRHTIVTPENEPTMDSSHFMIIPPGAKIGPPKRATHGGVVSATDTVAESLTTYRLGRGNMFICVHNQRVDIRNRKLGQDRGIRGIVQADAS